MKQVPIKRAMERVPGGLMVVPLLTGALLATFFPAMPQFFGSFTGALFTGALPILAVFFVCTGASIDFRATPYILKKGGTLFAVKVGIGILLGLIFGRLLGEAPITSASLPAYPTLAIVAAMERHQWRPVWRSWGSMASRATWAHTA
jgi:2-keto-3-deoxygluconate permease